MMTPDFVIIGAPRSGTTSLYHYLAQHPLIDMSGRKEPAFFHFANGTTPDFRKLSDQHGKHLLRESVKNYNQARQSAVTRADLYDRLWTKSGTFCRGEATPTYLYDRAALSELKRKRMSVKSVIILRNPVERAYSEFLQRRRKGYEPFENFADALDHEPVEIQELWWGARNYVRFGQYANHVARAFEILGRPNVKVLLTEDLASDPDRALAIITEFLGIEPGFTFDSTLRYKEAFAPRQMAGEILRRQQLLRRGGRYLIPKVIRTNIWTRLVKDPAKKPPLLDEATRYRLSRQFDQDIKRLASLLGRDFSMWSDGSG